ncbi:2TM domain-containing protein [Segetibacter sp. 3557_3]|uniref:2TM domain-containing protein n=1 Tax=Segetibacter sp. 3557_3 TaxID=2547429 RepID=UPI0010587247|nr:2TM domain-containing protein [Segetibacter sp. 3557_3]TDH26215.1 2TM domain-containing protein [Segetibacter sp. 3557_3]
METQYKQNDNPNSSSVHDHNDARLWQLARRRASFKWNLRSYVILNVLFVIVWYFSSGPGSYYWPIWPMLGWGIGLASHYFSAYHEGRFNTIEKEYDKLKQADEKQ